MGRGYGVHSTSFDFSVLNNYNGIAGSYDALAKSMFRGDILRAQSQFLHLIPKSSKILIIGGGTGQVLEKLNLIERLLTVDFVEPSGRMIEKAQRRDAKLTNLKLNFIQEKLENINFEIKYDVVCCFFFLDLFKRAGLKKAIEILPEIMSDNGQLLVTDFQLTNNKWWQRAISVVMHVFFKLTTNLASGHLKNIENYLTEVYFDRTRKAEYFNGFIFSAVYEKKVSKDGNHS